MKVQIKSSVHSYHFNGKRYLSGSIIEVPDNKFIEYIMEKVIDPAPQPVLTQVMEVEAVTPSIPEVAPEPVVYEEKPKRKYKSVNVESEP